MEVSWSRSHRGRGCRSRGLRGVSDGDSAVVGGAGGHHHRDDINSPVRRSDPEVVRRAAAERHLETLPTPTVTIWSDSSVDSGTTNGGGGAAIYLADGSEHALRVPAGSVCSSCGEAEMVSLRAALEELILLANIGPSDRVLVCTDSQSSLALLQAGPEAQR